jgi:hypothetical protein
MENINTNDPMRNTTSCVSASPDVRSEFPVDCSHAPAEAPQPTKAAKKRIRKAQRKAAAEAGLTGKAEGAESIALSGDTLAEAKAADEAKARQIVIDGVQADAAYIATRLEKYTECVIAEDEARQKRIVFADTFRDPEVRKRCQNVRDFFATKKTPEFLLGKDGVTQYFTAPEYFRNEAGVTYEYIRRLDIRFKPVTHLLPDGTAQPPQPRTRQPRVSPSDLPSGKVNVDELPEDARKKVLAAISGTGTTVDIPPAEGESDDAFTQEAPLTASVDEKVRAAFAYVEAKYARLMSLDEKEDFYFKLSKKFNDWDAPAAPQAELKVTTYEREVGEGIAAQAREDYTEEEVAAMFAGKEK